LVIVRLASCLQYEKRKRDSNLLTARESKCSNSSLTIAQEDNDTPRIIVYGLLKIPKSFLLSSQRISSAGASAPAWSMRWSGIFIFIIRQVSTTAAGRKTDSWSRVTMGDVNKKEAVRNPCDSDSLWLIKAGNSPLQHAG
jgi:hypothetical protein